MLPRSWWGFDGIEENMAISQDQEVHRTFFCVFIKFGSGSTVLRAKFVLTPVHLDEAKSNMEEYGESEWPVCIGSSDCTHITTDRGASIIWNTIILGERAVALLAHSTWHATIDVTSFIQPVMVLVIGTTRWLCVWINSSLVYVMASFFLTMSSIS